MMKIEPDDFVLEEPCGYATFNVGCEDGVLVSYDRTGKDAGTTCPRCNGKGWVLTGLGQHLLAFMKRHND